MKIKVEKTDDNSTVDMQATTSGEFEVRQRAERQKDNAASSTPCVPFKVKREPTEPTDTDRQGVKVERDLEAAAAGPSVARDSVKVETSGNSEMRGPSLAQPVSSPKVKRENVGSGNSSSQHSRGQSQQRRWRNKRRCYRQYDRANQVWRPPRFSYPNFLGPATRPWFAPNICPPGNPAPVHFHGSDGCGTRSPQVQEASDSVKREARSWQMLQGQPNPGETPSEHSHSHHGAPLKKRKRKRRKRPSPAIVKKEASSVSDETSAHQQPLGAHSEHNGNERHEMAKSCDIKWDIPGHSAEPSKKKCKLSRPLTSQDVREKAVEKIRAAQFRLLNEEMYLTSGAQAEQAFREDPQAFKYYHAGFQKQVAKWPINPVNVIIEELKKMPEMTVMADMGCGDAKIARALPNRTVHSFDLVALNDRVTECDMSNVPLESSSVGVVVFCLSLMGTNLSSFILEANRILKLQGILKIAEVESRFSNIKSFLEALKMFGFVLVSQNRSYKMFVLLEFRKVQAVKKSPGLPDLKLKPCLYKKR